MTMAAAAQAQTTRTNLGTLTCTLSEAAEPQKAPAPVAQERAMRCAFKPTNEGAELTYSGIIRQIGQGQLPQGQLVMIWVVQGPAEAKLEPGLLAQSYVGSREQGAGAFAKPLLGERNPDIALRFETNDNVPTGLAVMVMELKVLTVPT
jgi:hypothetical protein